MNKIILIGRLCHDPEIKYIGEKNTAVSKFTLAVDRNYKNANGTYDTDFIKCEIWNKQAETFCQYLNKGRLICIEGALRNNRYLSSDGENKKYTFVKCDSFKFIDSKPTFNRDDIFTEEVFDEEISESEIPF